MRGTIKWLLAVFALLAVPGVGHAEDGYDLWLRYQPLAGAPRAALAQHATALVVPEAPSPTLRIAAAELDRGLTGLLGAAIATRRDPIAGALVIGTPASVPGVTLDRATATALGTEGYLIRSTTLAGKPVTLITANTDVGLLHGAFAWLRLAETGAALDKLDVRSAPKIAIRMLNHWDNLDRTVERGYAGQSIWDWWRLPDWHDPRYTDYARANASIGINGAVLNNVNAAPEMLTPHFIAKAAALADIFRPYGIKVWLSVNFAAPKALGDLDTADPTDPRVARWWQAKADEIYAAIPDFGGFLVKANSEGQPGPGDYQRSQAEGANMLAAALRPHQGVVIWRAFVYAAENPEDRARQAYSEFKPLDGKFAANVIVQVKNGPIDFQPREPFSPLFGAMPGTPLALELQITKEYLGFATHLVYLAPLFEETLDADTFAQGKGSTVAKVVEGRLDGHKLSAIAGVANIGSDRDWSGSDFDQANWYAFGRLAWDPDLGSRAIAEEWIKQTFTADPGFVAPVTGMMMASRQAAVDYMTPLGLAHQMATGHHYGPGPWVRDLDRPEWNPVYYNRADANGIGFDRTASGSDAVAQYASPVAQRFASLATVGDDDLLWFHHLPWTYEMASGDTLWDALVKRYGHGVAAVADMQRTWAGLARYVDDARYVKATRFLAIQHREAKWWRDASIAYFQSLSKLPLPVGEEPPAHDLGYYEALRFPYAPGH
ncbi:alpha-glucuronidase family glycosyl hydrolase [Hephaestia sp. GCM10023244]|uniref:alpha-glucuronidase family glycosyl hydrolase n=1 Tax=unclassified Hephaestia TaxID=2631281 RepID=UPI0020772BAF|nr:alpha-glucuronidase family glycosyl hydrolase [Hephaestia sp. MAHUQ-44]MCM8730622.1 alpha-glucuronidase [Hephaestia sp. MAHUQ-44]